MSRGVGVGGRGEVGSFFLLDSLISDLFFPPSCFPLYGSVGEERDEREGGGEREEKRKI